MDAVAAPATVITDQLQRINAAVGIVRPFFNGGVSGNAAQLLRMQIVDGFAEYLDLSARCVKRLAVFNVITESNGGETSACDNAARLKLLIFRYAGKAFAKAFPRCAQPVLQAMSALTEFLFDTEQAGDICHPIQLQLCFEKRGKRRMIVQQIILTRPRRTDIVRFKK